MKKLALILLLITGMAANLASASSVSVGIVKKAEVITGESGRDGRPLLGAAVGVGIGSAIGSGSGKDAAMIVGGLLGAKRQASERKTTWYGWRYIVETNGSLQVVDQWCKNSGSHCAGVIEGTEVYVINGKEVVPK